METIGSYKIESTLVSGRRPIYLTTDKGGRKLIIKTAPLADLSPEEKTRFEREAEICKMLDHPNLLQVLDSGETEEMLYQVMEHLDGSDLSKVFASGRQFTWGEKLSIMEAVCDGLQFAHLRGLVHRDIKPANIFMTNSGGIRLIDFGMVRVASSELTRIGTTVGTLNYMAPEQIRAETCTAASDVFAVCIVFHQLCTGQHPFAVNKKTLPEILSATLFDEPAGWPPMDPPPPEGLPFVIKRALEKDPSKRWKDAGELRQALSLCRYTLEHGPSPNSQAIPAEESAVEAPAAEDPDKTMVAARSTTPISPPARPPEVPRPAAPQKTQPSNAAAPAPPKSSFCPSCAFPNKPGTSVCANCGRPIGAVRADNAAPESSPSTKLWIAIGILVVIVAVLLVIVAMR